MKISELYYCLNCGELPENKIRAYYYVVYEGHKDEYFCKNCDSQLINKNTIIKPLNINEKINLRSHYFLGYRKEHFCNTLMIPYLTQGLYVRESEIDKPLFSAKFYYNKPPSNEADFFNELPLYQIYDIYKKAIINKN